jgi:hypothetical protein
VTKRTSELGARGARRGAGIHSWSTRGPRVVSCLATTGGTGWQAR